LVTEGIWAIVPDVAAVRVCLGLRLAGRCVGGTEYLEGFKKCREGNLEVWCFDFFFIVLCGG
jgi:hypothetical protein